MKRIILTKGLPGSGKSTWALDQVHSGQGRVARVNKDALRDMLDGGRFTRSNEKGILETRDDLIRSYLCRDRIDTVIVDDTNLDPKHETRMREIAEQLNHGGFEIVVEINDSFLTVGLEECRRRDLKRANSVGPRVIDDMYYRYVAPSLSGPYTRNLFKPMAVIVDLDGTLAIHQDRSPFDYDRVGEDVLQDDVARAYHALSNNTFGIVLSGRPDSCRDDTHKWLLANNIRHHVLLMRKAEDDRSDDIVKSEIFHAHIGPYYNVIGVFDDRNRVVDMWRRLGLTVFQVADGNF